EHSLFDAGYTTGLIFVPRLAEAKGPFSARLDMLESSLAGCICFANPEMSSIVEELDRRKYPWIAIGQPGEPFKSNFVSADNFHASRKVGTIFARCGFTNALLLTHQMSDSPSAVSKATGFFQGYLEQGVSTEGIRVISCPSLDEAGGYTVLQKLLNESYRPQAIYVQADYLAMGAIRAIQEAGLRVPDDVSVVGSTGLVRARSFNPPLTVIEQPMVELGQTAVQLLHEMISEGILKCAPRWIQCRLRLRESLKVSDSIKSELQISE
ncbi:MAG TPA: substrate-binding domain-containing protein, partial [Tepidisphaeraceae bacterium]|nr:substrate-binding domain-containing protein [Tepidisphaeraceae bacterium]